MKKYAVDLCWGGSGDSWLEELEDERGQYYKVDDVDKEVEKLKIQIEYLTNSLNESYKYYR